MHYLERSMETRPECHFAASVDQGILVITMLDGAVCEDLPRLQGEVIGLLKSLGVMALLVDVRAVKGRPGFEETFFRVRNYPADTPRVWTAIVDTPEHAAYEQFHETTTVNAGWSLKCFTDPDAAKAWLLAAVRGSHPPASM
jgi:hypothetical protein